VVSRYQGGAFLVFSTALHDNLEVAALAGSIASPIGGAPGTVFARDADERTRTDPRILELEKALADPQRGDKPRLRAQLAETSETVRAEKLAGVTREFERIHSLQRAKTVGSVDHIVPPERLRPYLIEAVERGMEKEMSRLERGALRLAGASTDPSS
jgi:hypothetical protein